MSPFTIVLISLSDFAHLSVSTLLHSNIFHLNVMPQLDTLFCLHLIETFSRHRIINGYKNIHSSIDIQLHCSPYNTIGYVTRFIRLRFAWLCSKYVFFYMNMQVNTCRNKHIDTLRWDEQLSTRVIVIMCRVCICACVFLTRSEYFLY